MNKTSLLIISGAIIIIIFIIIHKSNSPISNNTNETPSLSSNVKIENGQQIITINVKGGYTPRLTNAKANLPTIIKAKTNNTFDCSSSLRIPSLNYFKNLPPSGETNINIPPQQAGTSLKGVCSMGMYSFTINFQG